MTKTVAIIGAGHVGATIAYTLIMKNSATKIFMIDTDKERCSGEVLDLADALAFSTVTTVCSADYNDARSADIIIICAGFAQKPGQSRLELLQKNCSIITDIMRQIEPVKTSAIVIIVTNPVDILTCVAQKCSSLPRNQIFGSGTWLDTQRLQKVLAQAFEKPLESIKTLVIGEHGDSQCVVWSQTKINNQPIENLNIDAKRLSLHAHTTKEIVYQIIDKKCATYYGVAACVAEICAIIFDDKQVTIPVSTYLPELNVCLSMPVVLGKNGIQKIIKPLLNKSEQECLEQSAKKLQKLLS